MPRPALIETLSLSPAYEEVTGLARRISPKHIELPAEMQARASRVQSEATKTVSPESC